MFARTGTVGDAWGGSQRFGRRPNEYALSQDTVLKMLG